MKVMDKLKNVKEVALNTSIANSSNMIRDRKKILKAIRWGTMGSIAGYIYGVAMGNMFFNIAGATLGFLTLVVYYEFREMTDTQKSQGRVLEKTLKENYAYNVTGKKRRLNYKDENN